MFRNSRSHKAPQVDLETVRETILYMRDDLRGVPGMDAVTRSLSKAIHEIDAANRPQPSSQTSSPSTARFFPRVIG